MRTTVWLPLACVALIGCDPGPNALAECDTFILPDLAIHDVTVTTEPEVTGAAFELRSAAPGAHLLDVSVFLELHGRSSDHDCVVALYLGEDVPDAAALPELPLGETPPATIDGLGTLAATLHVPRDWGGTDGATTYVEHIAGGPEPIQLHASLATCAEGALDVHLEFWGEYCLLDDADEGDPEKVAIDSFSSQQVW